ncbi:hypothetical protein WDU94_009154 [Cyamophila willieti]
MAVSQVRQNFHAETEEKINKQINLELYASYVYLSMSAHFNRDVVALHGISKFFKHASEEESEHAQKLIDYLNKRGGTLKLADVKAPARQEGGNPTEEAFSHALQLEKDVNQALLDLHLLASGHNDANFADFLESEFLQEQVDSIKTLADLLTNVRRVGEGLGIFVFDKELKS